MINPQKHTHTQAWVDIVMLSSLLKDPDVLLYHRYLQKTVFFNKSIKNTYVNVIVASLNGNRDAFGLPDAKLIVEGGDRANN